jgi:hypothetical protein
MKLTLCCYVLACASCLYATVPLPVRDETLSLMFIAVIPLFVAVSFAYLGPRRQLLTIKTLFLQSLRLFFLSSS